MEPLGDWLRLCPWKSRLVLIIRPARGHTPSAQAFRIGDKRTLLQESPAASTLIVVWPGEWSSSARIIGHADKQAVLDALA